MSFKKIGLALSFSPSMNNNLSVSLHLKRLFDAELFILHSANAKQSDREKLEQFLIDSKCDLNTIKIIEGEGEPAKFILKAIKQEKIDLLVAGALKKENILKQYVGSVARKLMNEASCSVFIVSQSSKFKGTIETIGLLPEYTEQCEKAIKYAYSIAVLDNVKSFEILKNIWIPGLSLTNIDFDTTKETEQKIEQYLNEEKEKIRIFINELNLSGKLPIDIRCFYEKYAINIYEYIQEHEIQLLVISSPSRKTNLFSRFFSDQLTYLFDNLPSNLLIIR